MSNAKHRYTVLRREAMDPETKQRIQWMRKNKDYKKRNEADAEVAAHDSWILRSLCELAKSYIQPTNTNINPIVDLLSTMARRDEAIQKRDAHERAWREAFEKFKATQTRKK